MSYCATKPPITSIFHCGVVGWPVFVFHAYPQPTFKQFLELLETLQLQTTTATVAVNVIRVKHEQVENLTITTIVQMTKYTIIVSVAFFCPFICFNSCKLVL
ncbi:hypothetical protein RvY_18971-2 [Ramazzottius varieornatus]|uniref:Uncharacterized protein n=1 Tax=Ramazzottius varieornatus TaxID=947166 RepID=A0A1D1WBC8_RAMVA|nr:hypothetical protein RvY_18971-2 [Ramazzottius varieornatus]